MFGGDHAGIDADHAVFQRFGDAVDAADVAAVEIARQAEFSVVGSVDGFLLMLEAKHRRERAEGFLFGAQHVGIGFGNHRRLEKLTLQPVAARQQLAAPG